MTTRTRAAGILTAITMTALLAACSADSGGDAGSSSAADVSTDGSFDAEGGADSSGPASRSELKQDAGATSSDAGSATTATPPTERSIISSGAVSLTSKDVGEARREVQRIVDAQGGEIAEEDTQTDDDGATSYARLVVRVPSAKFDAAMQALEGAADLRSATRGSDDVTTQVIDTGARVRAQEASLERVELLLAEAKSLKDIIWIESQLTTRQAELDSLTSQKSWLADQTALSTITVDISTPSDVVEEEAGETPAGFLVGLRGGLDAMSASFVAVATVLGALLPFALVALVVGFPLWLVLRRRRTGRPQAPAAQAPAAQ